MNEEIRKNTEILDDALENVSGGTGDEMTIKCICGGTMHPQYMLRGAPVLDCYYCTDCGRSTEQRFG